ncbi:RNA-binding domain-containing protein [Miniphocaeibacter halophilus]|uniref:DNA binding domain-containing protein n=1 Tax=Miniphocaeibacter halophilus TaxID=2931922 RepID=A0AC61MPZ4_9FIRM|nr:RNA-binding domain-containing protein [Miniphocaeibacter halophilus]QQK06959.1 putative DNA binding domain-containing protein [Miniphocaeibacter halophilus]
MISKDLINEIMTGKETKTVEFKEAKNKIPKSIYETVCSFSNRNGGNIYLGIKDDGTIIGVDPNSIIQMKKDFVTTIQSNKKICPPLYLDINEHDLEGKSILHIFVPNSSQVHRLNNKIYDRNEDADIDITNNTVAVQQLFSRKQTEYTERKIYPYITLDDLDLTLIDKLKKAAILQEEYQSWVSYDHLEILKSIGMYSKDYITGDEGFTLAAAITFGTDELISSVLPYFRIDALLREEDIERYDDRENIRTNLIDSYDILMDFVKKHTSSFFYLENDRRINVRDILFRELIVNMLVHREYSNAYVSKLIIEKDSIIVENANKPIHPGIIKKGTIAPYPKNPTIAKVFNILGLIDEVGSGFGKIFKYTDLIYKSYPKIINEDIFKVCILKTNVFVLSDQQKLVVDFLIIPRTSKEILKLLNIKDLNTLRKNILNPLMENYIIERTIPDKPTSPNQKYKLIEKE